MQIPAEGSRRLGRLRAVLRLGERADRRPARHRVLAAAWPRRSKGPILELGCGTGRVALPVAAARRRPSSASIDRRRCWRAARARVRRARLARAHETDSRRHPPPAVSRSRSRWSWRRTASCSRCSTRRDLTATLKRVRARADAEGHVRPRARRRPAGVGRVLEARQPAREARAERQADHADRIGEAGSRKKHITRFEQEFVEGRGKTATRKKFTLAFRTAVGAADGPAARKGRASRCRPCSATTRAGRGIFGPMSGLSWPAGGKITSFAEFIPA